MMMDRPRAAPRASRRKWLLALVVVGSSLVVVATLRPAEPPVDRASLVIDTVRRGAFVHEIAAAGTLVAEESRLVAAPAAARVEAIPVEPGDRLRAGDIIVELSNREVVRELLEAEQQLAGAEADLADLASTLQARALESESALRRTRFERQDTRRQAEASSELARQGLISELEAVRRRETAEELAARVGSEERRHEALLRSADAQLAAQRNRLERQRHLQRFHRSVVDSLVVRAQGDTTVRDVAVQKGEWVIEGQRLVRLVEPGGLEAVLLVPEAVAHQVRVGQPVAIDARGTALRGRVARIAAAVEQGTLPVHVKLEGALPPGIRPELSVEGRIEIARMADALSIARSAHASAAARGTLYKLDRDGRVARKATVQYGPAGVDRIVIVRGAAAGDRFIVAGLDARTEAVVRLE
jgi:multidrug efflux pump subunit AcrA (membrane-fusion protein)